MRKFDARTNTSLWTIISHQQKNISILENRSPLTLALKNKLPRKNYPKKHFESHHKRSKITEWKEEKTVDLLEQLTTAIPASQTGHTNWSHPHELINETETYGLKCRNSEGLFHTREMDQRRSVTSRRKRGVPVTCRRDCGGLHGNGLLYSHRCWIATQQDHGRLLHALPASVNIFRIL